MSKCAAMGGVDDPSVMHFTYTNHRGEHRAVRIDAATALLWTGETKHHPEQQELLTAWDLDRLEERTYALRDVRWGRV
jgi:hypothetical protein